MQQEPPRQVPRAVLRTTAAAAVLVLAALWFQPRVMARLISENPLWLAAYCVGVLVLAGWAAVGVLALLRFFRRRMQD
jgi:hypothetical protein